MQIALIVVSILCLIALSLLLILTIKSLKNKGQIDISKNTDIKEIKEKIIGIEKVENTLFDQNSKFVENSNNNFGSFKSEMTKILSKEIEKINEKFQDKLKEINSLLLSNIKQQNDFKESINKDIINLKEINSETIKKSSDEFNKRIVEGLATINKEIDDKLRTKIEQKISDSFTNLKEDISTVSKNLNEFGVMSQELTKVRKLFEGVKTRGTGGEFLLEDLLADEIPNDLLLRQVNILKTKSAENVNFDPDELVENGEVKNQLVDFAIKHKDPKSGQVLLIPIDSKFPIESFQKYNDANSKEEQEKAFKQFKNDVLKMAKSIREKYIKPGITTPYAILYVPSNTIFLKASEFYASLPKDIVLVGPTLLKPMLVSLRMFNNVSFMQENLRKIYSSLESLETTVGYIDSNLSDVLKSSNTITSKATKARVHIGSALKKVQSITKQADKFNKEQGEDVSELKKVAQKEKKLLLQKMNEDDETNDFTDNESEEEN
ncbi:DNA anti-recombination protein RmuC [Metamycoplasma subdolum]|uniref:DNA anti-recombination protein RmuC n=1 Tax=Metamycoplasma subdolum TaxID=92407 RepID=A0A3L9ZZ56_9BACT|nr:DNA recombination protein RmuC [Metamycoplasma subdolum]RMA77414.1 DNA anti-recombination protein RmuC [Metamycoplasma subdolum]WPB50409.1 DNA recombination protein RmuC [Metamycoplasma subdolum]